MSKYTINIIDEPQSKEIVYQRSSFSWHFYLPESYDLSNITISQIKEWLSAPPPDVYYTKLSTSATKRTEAAVRDFVILLRDDGFEVSGSITKAGVTVILPDESVDKLRQANLRLLTDEVLQALYDSGKAAEVGGTPLYI